MITRAAAMSAQARERERSEWKEMPGTESSCRPSNGSFALVAVIAIVVMHASSAISPAYAQVHDGTRSTAADTTWPTFTDALNDPVVSLSLTPEWTRQGIENSSTVISAPLPQAAATGLFMLAGNWVVTRLWKKRKL